jgi:hypothetical protein
MKRYAALVFAVVLYPNFASAATVTCPPVPGPSERVFTLTTDPGATCLAWGAGNVNGNGDVINTHSSGPWTTLDKTDRNGGDVLAMSGALGTNPLNQGRSGTFAIDPAVWTNFARVVIAFKSGQGQADPDWAAFELPNGMLTGAWSIIGFKPKDLSHANLYGQGTPVQTPEPGTLDGLLVGFALLLAVWRLSQ